MFYILDRLRVPLVEIATDPDILDPDHAMETARIIGTLLRSTRSVRRGLGSFVKISTYPLHVAIVLR